jgi:hypothetical protein
MTIALHYQAQDIALPDDLAWTDEYAWTPVGQSRNYTLTGALVIQSAARQAGRPYTLAASDDNTAWVSRATLDALYAMASIAGAVLTLDLRGSSRPVVFDHSGTPIEAVPIVPYADPVSTDAYRITLRLIGV